MNIPTLKQINEIESEELLSTVDYFYNLSFLDTTEACWVVIIINALIQEAKVNNKKARLVMKMPEGHYTTWDICPVNQTVNISEYVDNIYNEDFVMSEELNNIMYVSGWKNCEEHAGMPPILTVIEGDLE